VGVFSQSPQRLPNCKQFCQDLIHQRILDMMDRNSGPGSGFVSTSALLDLEWTYAIHITFPATDSLTL
jgi:hypothetical protein